VAARRPSGVAVTLLRWYRSWPAPGQQRAEGRARVEDHLPRLVMRDCDYSTADLPTDLPGFCMLEWDVALDVAGRDRFAAHAFEDPERILVAPYLIYPHGAPPVVVHKSADNPKRIGHRRPIPEGQDWAHSFGFGCIYFPQVILDDWRAGGRRRMTDARFSDWHIANHGTVEVTWWVAPQHLHGD
jgi:hypothetical protein